MAAANDSRGQAMVMQPGQGPSYWQPVPANGHADPALFPAIGRERSAGESAPAPFARPDDVAAIERQLGMNDTVR